MATNSTKKAKPSNKVSTDIEKEFDKNIQLIQVREKNLRNLKTDMGMLDNEIEKAEQLRTQFLSNVSHEIKTPLNSILSATVLLQQKSLDGETAELVETIHHSGQYLFTLLNDILDYY
jgi:signal transduction histidine kinase